MSPALSTVRTPGSASALGDIQLPDRAWAHCCAGSMRTEGSGSRGIDMLAVTLPIRRCGGAACRRRPFVLLMTPSAPLRATPLGHELSWRPRRSTASTIFCSRCSGTGCRQSSRTRLALTPRIRRGKDWLSDIAGCIAACTARARMKADCSGCRCSGSPSPSMVTSSARDTAREQDAGSPACRRAGPCKLRFGLRQFSCAGHAGARPQHVQQRPMRLDRELMALAVDREIERLARHGRPSDASAQATTSPLDQRATRGSVARRRHGRSSSASPAGREGAWPRGRNRPPCCRR